MSEHDRYQQAAVRAICLLQQKVRWKPDKDKQHLSKRKAMGLLPDDATVDDYNALIRAVLNGANSLVYRYPFGERDYYAVCGEMRGVAWLLIFSEDGIMETAFPPDDLADYMRKRGFVPLGKLGEMVHE